jgi:hypothetical protein
VSGQVAVQGAAKREEWGCNIVRTVLSSPLLGGCQRYFWEVSGKWQLSAEIVPGSVCGWIHILSEIAEPRW